MNSILNVPISTGLLLNSALQLMINAMDTNNVMTTQMKLTVHLTKAGGLIWLFYILL